MFTLVRSALSRSLRQPASLVLGLLLLAQWPLWRVVAPLLLTTSGRPAWSLLYEVAFLGALVGAASALPSLREARWSLEPLGRARRRLLELAVLVALSGVGELLALAPALVVPAGAPEAGLPRAACALALVALHVSALALLAAQARTGALESALLFLALAWIVPAFAPPHGVAGRVLAGLLDAGRHADPDWIAALTVPAFLVDMMPVAGLLIVAGLLPPPPPPTS